MTKKLSDFKPTQRNSNRHTAPGMDSIEKSKVKSLTPDANNANAGTQRGQKMIEASVQNNGLGRSLLVDKNGRIIAGNKTTEAIVETMGEDTELIIVETDGTKAVAVKRTDLDLTDPDPNNPARKLAYLDNLTSYYDFGLDPETVIGDVTSGFDFGDIGISDLDLAGLMPDLDWGDDLLDVEDGAQPNPRELPLDLIFTYDALYEAATFMAFRAGWKIGTQSIQKESGAPHTHLMRPELWDTMFPVTFIDNDYFNYDHKKHCDIIRQHKPKYCTTRDLMTKEQCLKAGIKYFCFEEVLDQAVELKQYAQNVILIPKYDCIDRIPQDYILGYSVPTSHGGTPLPVSAFKGRPCHLLGGSWKKQLEHMAELGDDVISVDNNYIQLQSKFGSFVYADGQTGSLSDFERLQDVSNPMYIALSISLGSIAAKISQLYKPAEPANHPV